MDKPPPGWNDPPAVNFPVQIKPRTQLNKRVAFPLSKQPEETNESIKQSTVLEAPPLNDSTPKKVTENKTIENQKNELPAVKELFDQILNNFHDESKKNDIFKRLDVMFTMWENNKLSSDVQKQIVDFSECIKSNEIDKGNNIYLSLTLNSALYCSTWIIAFKYIIHYYKT